MDADPRPSRPSATESAQPGAAAAPEPHRLFLHEPGWSVALKVGSERAFCYQIAPGQDYYHRLLDGEIYLTHGDERLCLACAVRQGLLSLGPRTLRASAFPADLARDLGPGDEVFEVQIPLDPPAPGEGRPAR